jgi:hypothetical protein
MQRNKTINVLKLLAPVELVTTAALRPQLRSMIEKDIHILVLMMRFYGMLFRIRCQNYTKVFNLFCICLLKQNC